MAKIDKNTVKVFAQGVKDFMTHLGLGDWEIALKQEDLSELGDNALAAVACDLENCLAEFSIAPEWPDSESIDQGNVRKVALHEVLHVLLFRYDRLAHDRFTTSKQLLDTEHDIIRRIVMMYIEVKRKDR
jgi:hypothetical protein